jgi:peptidyl-prolyl cis-trans isomerase A (cyclophilin A)
MNNRFTSSLLFSAGVISAGFVVAGCASQDRMTDQPGSIASAVEFETTAGTIRVELNGAAAPVTVRNFLSRVQAGQYDGTIFHRVVPGFVVQGGGWTIDLKERAKQDAAAGRPDVPIVNEWKSGLKNLRGTIAMAREEAPDSATREFYINLSDNARLDMARPNTGNAGYCAFGRVVSGMDVVDQIAAGKTESRTIEGVTDGSMNNVPLKPVIITKARIVPR